MIIFQILGAFACILAMKIFLVWYDIKASTKQKELEEKHGDLDWRVSLYLAFNCIFLTTVVGAVICLIGAIFNFK